MKLKKYICDWFRKPIVIGYVIEKKKKKYIGNWFRKPIAIGYVIRKKKKIDPLMLRRERNALYTAVDVAIQWLDEGKPEEARAALAEVYTPILQRNET